MYKFSQVFENSHNILEASLIHISSNTYLVELSLGSHMMLHEEFKNIFDIKIVWILSYRKHLVISMLITFVQKQLRFSKTVWGNKKKWVEGKPFLLLFHR